MPPNIDNKKLFGLALIPAFLLIIILLAKLNLPLSYEPAFLLGLLNTLFLGIIPIIVAYISMRVYTKSGSVSVFLIGSGILIFGLGSIAAGWVNPLPGGPNMTVTIHNSCALASSIFILVGAVLSNTSAMTGRGKGNTWLIAATYTAILFFVTLFSLGTLQGIIPPFFIPGSGPTVLRQIVLENAVAFFMISSVLLWFAYTKRKSEFFFWYTLAMALVTIGLMAVFFQSSVGSVIGWVGRSAQYLGCIFLLYAVLITRKAAAAKGLPLDEVIANFFGDAEENYRQLVETATDAIVTIDEDDRILLWNSGAERMFGYSRSELSGKSFFKLVLEGPQGTSIKNNDQDSPGAGMERTDEIVGKCKDGRQFPVELTQSRHVANGRLIRTFILRDITEHKLAEQALRNARHNLEIQVQERTVQLTKVNKDLLEEMAERRQAEEALRESEKKYYDLFQNSLVAFAQTAPDGRLITINDAFVQMYGYSRVDEALNSITDVGRQYKNPECINEIRKILEGKGSVQNFETEHLKQDGTPFWVSISARIIKDRNGDVLSYDGTIIDITQRKQAEEFISATLKRARDQQGVLGTISFSPCLFSGDVHGLSARLTEVSSEVFGVERVSVWLFNSEGDELQCIDLYESSHDRHSYDHILKRDEFVNEFLALSNAKYIDAHDPLTDPRTAGYVEGYLKPNRITSMLDALIRVSGQNLGVLCFEHVDRPHHWENDEISFACQLADQIAITLGNRDRKRAEEALAVSEEKYRALFAAESDGIFVVDKDTGIIIDCNDSISPIYGYHKDEVIGQKNTFMSAEPDATTEATREVTNYIPVRYHKRKDGSIFPVEITANVISIKGRDMILAAVRDITERKRIEDALKLTSKKLSILSSITRHDINNQLTVLGGYLSILKKKHNDPILESYFEKASTAAERIIAMIQFTKEYEEIGVHTPDWQDCRTIVNLAVKEVTIGKITIINDFPSGAEVFADPLIGKVFFNLIDNAVRHGGKIGTILFSIEDCNGNYCLVCEDDGDGVPQDEKEKIFERGYGKNTGLGLALVREILAITGITIHETGEPGKGARFEISVPKGMYR
ncbi:MAG: PAS domain S-box protein [Methanomicrobiales archaeon]